MYGDAFNDMEGRPTPVSTGCLLYTSPKGYDAVIPVEQSERIEYPDLPESFGRPSEKVKLAPGKPGQFVRRRGEDVVTGQVLARAGERVTPALLGALASPPAMPEDIYLR